MTCDTQIKNTVKAVLSTKFSKSPILYGWSNRNVVHVSIYIYPI